MNPNMTVGHDDCCVTVDIRGLRPTGVLRKFSWGMVICIWCALFVTSQIDVYSCFQTNVLAKCVDIIGILFYTHTPYFMCDCTEYKLSALQVRISEENKPNASSQGLITANVSGCVLKQGSKTHSSLRQSNLQRKNEAGSVLSSIGSRWRTPRFARSNFAKLHKD